MKRTWLIAARREKDMTQAELAKQSGVAQGTISGLESGKIGYGSSPKTVKKISNVLDIDWHKFYE